MAAPAMIDAPPSFTPAPPRPTAPSVAQYVADIRAHIRGRFNVGTWVWAEVAEFTRHAGSGHCYFTLSAPCDDGKAAKVRANLWKGRAVSVLTRFEQVAGT